MKRMLLIFSHSLTPEQKEEGERNLSVKEFVYIPYDLKIVNRHVRFREYKSLKEGIL